MLKKSKRKLKNKAKREIKQAAKNYIKGALMTLGLNTGLGALIALILYIFLY